MTKLEYNISQLGYIKAYVCNGYASKCYDFLKYKKFVDRLSNINQLGVINYTSFSTNHDKKEYLILQLYLINQLMGRGFDLDTDKEKSYNLGLSNKYEIKCNGNIENPSSAEILQIWVLLFTCGHLPETFASEKGFMKAMQNDHNLLKVFKKGLPKEILPILNYNLENNHFHNIHKFLILFLIQRRGNTLYKLDNGHKLSDFLEEVIKKYFLDDSPKTKKLKFYYNQIRRLSYIFLDTQYSAFPISFNLSIFLLNLDDNLLELVNKKSYLNRTLDSLDNLLSHNLYYSDKSMKFFTLHSNDIYNKLYKNNKKLTELVEILQKNCIFFKYTNENCEKFSYFHIYFDTSFSAFSNKLNGKLEKKWNKHLGENSLLNIENSRNFSTLTIVFTGGNDYNHILSVSRLMLKIIGFKNSFYSDFKKKIEENHNEEHFNNMIKFYDDIVTDIFNQPFEDIFLFILNKSYNVSPNNNLIFNFDEYSLKPRVVSICGKENINKEFERWDIEQLNDSQKHELDITKCFARNLIKNKSSKALISLSSIKIRDMNKNELVAEFDGSILMFKDKKIYLYLIEAKKLNHRSTKHSKKDLEDKINKINFKYCSKELIQLDKNIKGSCYELVLSDN